MTADQVWGVLVTLGVLRVAGALFERDRQPATEPATYEDWPTDADDPRPDDQGR